jgi:acetylornithine deacetylase/succinyl-diaminopimelate desuccinylase-like protein
VDAASRLDGEEEAGSPNFEAAMIANAPRCAATSRGRRQPAHPSNLPTVFYGSRGLTGAEITIYGATGDLHSGNYGNFVPDPAMALARLLASMKDERGDVVIKNFYDGVVPLTASERRAIDEIPNVDQKLLEQFGVAQSEHPDSRIELQHNRPTLSVVGLSSGPSARARAMRSSASATGRVEIRLVNGLDAKTQYERLVAHIREQGYSSSTAPPDMATRGSTRRSRGDAARRRFPDRQRDRWTIRAPAMAANAIRALDSAPGADADNRRQPAVLNVRPRCRCRRSASPSSTSTTTSTR